MGTIIDLTGKQFGRLTVVRRSETAASNGNKKWECLCSCGKTVYRPGTLLRYGHTKSCGCYRVDYQKIHNSGSDGPNWTGHGELSGTKWDYIVKGAKTRKIEFALTIEEAWALFLKQNRLCALSGIPLHFDDGKGRHSGNASLDRIDSKKGYTIDNVQWVDKRINVMKWHLPEKEFLDLCQKIVNHRG